MEKAALRTMEPLWRLIEDLRTAAKEGDGEAFLFLKTLADWAEERERTVS